MFSIPILLYQTSDFFSIKHNYLLQQNSCQPMQTTCPKCEQKFSQQNPPKNLINCNHVLCLACLSNEILCPIDRKRLERRKYTLEAFQTNKEILEFILGEEEAEEKAEEKQEEMPAITVEPPAENKNEIPQPNVQITTEAQKQIKQPSEVQPSEPSKATQVEVIPQKSQEVNQQKFEDITFDTCLLHSKPAELICLKDKCLICSNCGLFGEHKNHELLPYDVFMERYTVLMEQSYSIFQLLKKAEEQLDHQAIQQEVNQIIKEKREGEVKNIKKYIAGLIQTIKNSEKQAITELDLSLKSKKQKLMKDLQVVKLQGKVNQYYSQIEKITQGFIDIFRLEKIETYIDYVDDNHSKSYVNKEGEYLIAEVDAYAKALRMQINSEVAQVEFQFNNKLNQLIADTFHLPSSGFHPNAKPEVKETVPEITTITIKSPLIVKKVNEQDLLINSNEKEEVKQKNVRSMSPIQPIPKFQETFDTTFKNSYKESIISGVSEEIFLKVRQAPNGPLYLPPHKKAGSFGNKTTNLSAFRQNEVKKDGVDLLNPIKIHGKERSNNSSHIVEREILSVLNENRKKKKLQIPEKYGKIYQDLQKDKLDVVDFGGACLGDQTILSISELFENKGKLKSAKLMNNKITDEIFPDLLFRCRHLHSLNLSYNNLTEKSLEWLEKEVEYLGSLSNITISNNKIVLRNVKDRIENLRKRGIKVSL